MPSRANDAARWLHHIHDNIALAQSFVQEITYERFCDDTLYFYAVTRCLEIISEASRRLPDETKARHPGIPCVEMAAAGNIYRHDYEDVAQQLVWRTVHSRLPTLAIVVDEELRRLSGPL